MNWNYLLFVALALPSFGMMAGAFGAGNYEQMLHPTGEFSARFLIITMIITPFRMMFPTSKFWRWMGARKRYFGVAAFGYAFLHTLFYLIDMGSWTSIWKDAFVFGIWTGWLAFIIFVPLAMTSNNWSVRKLGKNWKFLQRFVYVAAVATLLHWIFVHNDLGPALVHFVPLAILEGYRIYKNMQKQKGVYA